MDAVHNQTESYTNKEPAHTMLNGQCNINKPKESRDERHETQKGLKGGFHASAITITSRISHTTSEAQNPVEHPHHGAARPPAL